MVHYFTQAVKVKDKTHYKIGKQSPGKPTTFLKKTYASSDTARRNASEMNKKHKGRGKPSKKPKAPQYESL